jgi:hypothetical protein
MSGKRDHRSSARSDFATITEAKQPDKFVFDLDELNEHFPDIEISTLINANDIVNPATENNLTNRSRVWGCAGGEATTSIASF